MMTMATMMMMMMMVMMMVMISQCGILFFFILFLRVPISILCIYKC